MTTTEFEDPFQGEVPYERRSVRLADLHPHPENYKSHPPEQIEHLKASIAEFGVYRAILTARDGTIIAGHGVVQAAVELRPDIVAEEVRYDLDPRDPRAIKLLALDNEVGRRAYSDDRQLSELLKRVNEAPETTLVGTGYDDMMLANLLLVSRPSSEIGNRDAAAEYVGMPDYTPEGDTWKIVVNFKTEADRNRFIESFRIRDECSITKSVPRAISCWWPPLEEIRHDSSLKWEQPNGADR